MNRPDHKARLTCKSILKYHKFVTLFGIFLVVTGQVVQLDDRKGNSTLQMNGKSFSQAEINRRSNPKVDFVLMPRDLKQLQSQYPSIPSQKGERRQS